MPGVLPATPLGSLQEGIYIERRVPPPAAWRALFLDVRPQTAARDAHDAVEAVMRTLSDLQRGIVRDLADRPDEQAGAIPLATFAALLGYGASFFDDGAHAPRLTAAERPRHVVGLRRDGPAFPTLPWADPPAGHGGESDLLLQFTGLTEHAVDRAAVEVSKVIEDLALPLVTAGTHSGFQRDDGRSWIGFHDGVTNIEPSQRMAAVECIGDPGWNRGGTYLAFLRIEVALRRWRTLSRPEQEALVGRDKLSGCPIDTIAVDDDGLRTSAIGDCPLTATSGWRERGAFLDPPETTDRLVEASHVHRVNQNRTAPTTNAGHRIFRQGYEYLDDIGPDGARLGLNFVSFQNDLEHLRQILGLEGWLGDVNFGGPAAPRSGEPTPVRLMTLRSGGFYAVPPRERPFAGASLFA